jgi:hypothetical protein
VVKDPQMALMNLMADIDHDVEGIRVHGSDPLDGDNWEVGEVFFRNWVSLLLVIYRPPCNLHNLPDSLGCDFNIRVQSPDSLMLQDCY